MNDTPRTNRLDDAMDAWAGQPWLQWDSWFWWIDLPRPRPWKTNRHRYAR